MFHSTIISEPLAHLIGLCVGLLTFAISTFVTPDRQAQLWAATVASVLCNLAVGAKVNTLTLDILALIIMRPLSALASGPLLAALVNRLL